jgi:hypothetical protein
MAQGTIAGTDIYPLSPAITGTAAPAPDAQVSSGGKGMATGTKPIMYWVGILGALILLRLAWERAA